MQDHLPEDQTERFRWLCERVLGHGAADSRRWRDSYLAALEQHFPAHVPSKSTGATATARSSSPEQPGSEWKRITPSDLGGRIRCLAMHPGGDRLYAGAASGGLWKCEKTEDGWAPWKPVSSPHFSIGALAIAGDAESPVIYAGTGEPYVRLVFPGIGVLKSTDGGKRWDPTGDLPLDSVAQILVDPADANVLYCAGPKGLYKTCDRGASWRPVTFGNISSVALDSDHRLVVGVYGLGLFRKDDDFWRQLGTTTFKSPRFRVLVHVERLKALEKAKADHYFARLDGEVWLSANAGASSSWKRLQYVHVPADDWASHIWVHPSRTEIFIGGGGLYQKHLPAKLQRLTNPDFNRCQVKHQKPRTFEDHHAMARHSEGETLFCACDGGVFRAAEPQTTHWRPMLRGLDVSQFYDLAVSPHDNKILGGGTQDLGTWFCDATGQWSQILSNDGGHLVFDPHDPNVVWAQEQTNIIYRINLTSGQGKRCDAGLDEKAPFIGVLIADPRKSNSGLLFTGRRHVFRLHWKPGQKQGANRWRKFSPRLGGDVSSLAQHPLRGSLFAGTSTGRVWWLQEDGATLKNSDPAWVDLTELPSANRLPRRYINRIVTCESDEAEDSIYVCFGGSGLRTLAPDTPKLEYPGQIFYGSRTAQGWGWEDRTGSDKGRLPDFAVHGLVVDQPHSGDPGILYAATDVGIFRSKNSGKSWQLFSSGLPLVPCFDICLSPDGEDKSSRLLRVATHGRGIYEIQV